MKTVTLYKYMALALVLINAALLFFIAMGGPKPPPISPEKTAAVYFKLDERQRSSFNRSAESAKKKVKFINGQQSDILQRYFGTLTKTSPEVNPEALLGEMQLLENRKIVATYVHLSEVKLFLNEEQLEKFDGFVEQVLADMGAGEKNDTRVRRIPGN